MFSTSSQAVFKTEAGFVPSDWVKVQVWLRDLNYTMLTTLVRHPQALHFLFIKLLSVSVRPSVISQDVSTSFLLTELKSCLYSNRLTFLTGTLNKDFKRLSICFSSWQLGHRTHPLCFCNSALEVVFSLFPLHPPSIHSFPLAKHGPLPADGKSDYSWETMVFL